MNPMTKVKLIRSTILAIYVLLVIFWLYITFTGSQEGFVNNLFGTLYPVISVLGAVYGFFVAKKWGAWKSVVGRGILLISLGLLGEAFGQWAWSYYTVVKEVEVPYPSVADIGYFSIIPFYGLAMYHFAKASGVNINLKSFFGKLQALIVPITMIVIAYVLFLKDIEVDFSQPLKTFLDFGYPGFEAIAVSIGILTYSLSRGVLGGRMKPKVLFIVIALIAQYVTDYTFLYTVGIETYYNGGIVDLMYTTSLMLMSLALVSFSKVGDRTE